MFQNMPTPKMLAALYAPDGKKEPQLLSPKESYDSAARSKELASRLQLSDPLEAEILLRYNINEETIPRDPGLRAALIEGLGRLDAEPPPAWQLVSGLLLGYEDAPNRRERLRALWKATVLLIRRELKWHEAELAEGKNLGERSVYWDPVGEVTRRLGISQSKLSGLLRELTGSNLVQTIDNVKAEGLKGKLRREVREFVVKLREEGKREETLGRGDAETRGKEEALAQGATFVTEDGDVAGLDKWAVWKALKASRKYPEFCWNSWARALGFASYRRLYRACVCVYDQTPHQMILELIEEALRNGERADGANGADGTNGADGFRAWSLEEIEGELRAVKPFSMLT